MKKITFLIILAFCLGTLNVNAQCKEFVKSDCLPKIAPFVFSGTQHALTISSKEKTSVTLTFYAGQVYRLLVCGEKKLGTVHFKVLDLAGGLLFDSKAHNETDFWDFKAENTFQVKVEIEAAPAEKGGVQTGCAAVVIGIKATAKNIPPKK